MKLTVRENENGEGFLNIEIEEGDSEEEFEEMTSVLSSDRLIFDVEGNGLVVYFLPFNIELGYN